MARVDHVVRDGLIGTGTMGVEHIRNVDAPDGALVIAISDADAGSREAGADAAGDVLETDLHAVIEQPPAAGLIRRVYGGAMRTAQPARRSPTPARDAFVFSGYPPAAECDLFARHVRPSIDHGRPALEPGPGRPGDRRSAPPSGRHVSGSSDT